jgi:hypothetical protein
MRADSSMTIQLSIAASRSRWLLAGVWAFFGVVSMVGISPLPASAQVPPPPSAGAPPMLPGSIDLPGGAGAGVHGANSPYAPLVERADVVAWSVLTDVKTKVVKKRILPAFNTSQMALNEKVQRIQGFMLPLEPGEKHRRFLLSRVPLTCGFCLPGGPESMIEVRTKTPVKYSLEAVVVEGQFLALNDDEYGLYYRLTGAAIVK